MLLIDSSRLLFTICHRYPISVNPAAVAKLELATGSCNDPIVSSILLLKGESANSIGFNRGQLGRDKVEYMDSHGGTKVLYRNGPFYSPQWNLCIRVLNSHRCTPCAALTDNDPWVDSNLNPKSIYSNLSIVVIDHWFPIFQTFMD